MTIAHDIQSIGFLTGIRESALVFPILLATHLAIIAAFGGMILMTDMRLLDLGLKSRPVSAVVGGVRIAKRFGFVLMVSVGLLLGLSEAEKYSINPFFWIKMTLLVCVLIHGAVFKSSVYDAAVAGKFDAPGSISKTARTAAWLSIIMWIAIPVMGRLIGYYEPKDKSNFPESPAKVLVVPAQQVASR
jgi:hypothetical protein